MKKIFLIPAALLLMATAACFLIIISQPKNCEIKTGLDFEKESAEIDRTIGSLMKKSGTVGLSVAVIHDGKVVFTKGYGYKNKETASPVTNDTVFEAASLSKPVFAYAVLRYALEGNFDLERPVSDYYDFPELKSHEYFKEITPKMILTHTTGLPNWREGATLAFLAKPGSGFYYSGEAYVLLQKCIEHVTGETIDQFVSRYVFAPLEMKSSSFVWRDGYETRCADGYDAAGNIRQKSKPFAGSAASTLHTTAKDYAKFMTALLNDTKAGQYLFDTGNVVKRFGQTDYVAWGYGVGLQHTGQGLSFWHWGDNKVFKAYMVGFIHEKAGVVYFTNSENGLNLRNGLVDLMLGGSHPAFAFIDYPQVK